MNSITEKEYLHTSYRPDCDFADGLLLLVKIDISRDELSSEARAFSQVPVH